MTDEIQITKVVTIGLLLDIEAKIKNKKQNFYVWIDEENKYTSKEKKVVDEVKKLMPEIFI